MSEYEELAEQTISSEEVYNGRLLHIFRDVAKLPNGEEAIREHFMHNGASAIVAITEDGNIILERQFRYPFHDVITEIPAGKLDKPDEDRLEAAKREFLEETGYTAKNWVCLGDFYPSVAYTNENITCYLATGLEKGEQKLDEDEFLNVFEMPFKDAVKEILEGKINDGKTQTAILKAYLYLQEKEL